MKKIFFSIALALVTLSSSHAGSPLWTFTPLTPTTLTVPNNATATVQYLVSNQSSRAHTLNMQPITGITQKTTGLGVCGNPFVLAGKRSCTLSLQINGSQITQPILNGPIVCEQGSTLQCYRPAASDLLRITQSIPALEATITVSGSPLTLIENGSSAGLTITNTSLTTTATNITSNFAGTALDGNVTETGNTCASLAPQNSCMILYTPGSMAISQTDFTLAGTNTNTTTAAIQIDAAATLTSVSPSSGPAAGGTGVTLTGTALTGATGVSFGGTAATSVNVINSTTVTAVSPAHAIGATDVAITTASGTATLTNAFTYTTTIIGQPTFGGIIACLNGGLNNLIAAIADQSTGIIWGTMGLSTGATSNTDGASNTTTNINTVGQTLPNAASICDNYEIDSQGNSPCQSGNTCFNDWYLPSGNNSTATGQLNCLYVNRMSIGNFNNLPYWSSTENNANTAWDIDFNSGSQQINNKSVTHNVRCVRNFIP